MLLREGKAEPFDTSKCRHNSRQYSVRQLAEEVQIVGFLLLLFFCCSQSEMSVQRTQTPGSRGCSAGRNAFTKASSREQPAATHASCDGHEAVLLLCAA